MNSHQRRKRRRANEFKYLESKGIFWRELSEKEKTMYKQMEDYMFFGKDVI